jgi:hypothetical protein
MFMAHIDYALARRLFDYNPVTGHVYWKIPRGYKIKAGDRAGCIYRDYRWIHYRGKSYLEHRLIWLWMTGQYPADHIDHINHDKIDNRWCNLRSVSEAVNHRNKPLYRSNTSGTAGVTWDKQKQQWHAYIRYNKKLTHLGFFDELSDAVLARQQAKDNKHFHPNHGT